MRKIVFDIETCSYPFDSLSESQQEYILRYAEKEADEDTRLQKKDEAIRYMSLYPFTSKIISIGIYDVAKEKSYVCYESDVPEEQYIEDKKVLYKGMTEAEMIKSFWRVCEAADQLISFNGKVFDAPFIMIRSAMNRIKPVKNLVSKKYDSSFHVDLLEQFTFFGLVRKFNLDFYCHAFGIESPKSKGVNGMEVKNLYEAGRIKDIAVYCGEDIFATYQLYKIWDEYINIKG